MSINHIIVAAGEHSSEMLHHCIQSRGDFYEENQGD